MIIHRAQDRGKTDIDWLDSYHSFSFGEYYDPSKMGYGVLRVLNDDIIAGGEGFPTHGHANMEIITLVLEGVLEHKDSMGNKEQLHPDEVQVMTAGSGITHSEYNASKTKEVKLLQLWILPEKKNLTPQYDQKQYAFKKNTLTQIVGNKSLPIHQKAQASVGVYDKDQHISYKLKHECVYLFVIEGELKIESETLRKRDAAGLDKDCTMTFTKPSKILIIDMVNK